MSRNHPRPRWRDRLPGRRSEPNFHWRGKEVSRLENLADGVFALSVTLLVITTEVPRTYAGLLDVVRTFPAFVASFALLMIFWNVHYKFFRRYGLEDFVTRTLNYAVLLLVLFAVYPLKFLFSTWLTGGNGVDSLENLWTVYRLYGCGLAGIWVLFGAMFVHALRRREQLGLSPSEVVLTRLDIWGAAINIGTCLLSIGLSFLPVPPWLPGVIYGTLGFTMAANGIYHGNQVRRLQADEPARR